MRKTRHSRGGIPFAAFLVRALVVLGIAGVAVGEQDRESAALSEESPEVPDATGARTLDEKREVVHARVREPIVLEAPSFRLYLDRRDPTFRLEDRQTGESWHLPLDRRGFASVLTHEAGQVREFLVDRWTQLKVDSSSCRFVGRSTKGSIPDLLFELKVTKPLVGLEISVGPASGEGPLPERVVVKLLDRAFWIADASEGGILLPVGQGEWLDTKKGGTFRRILRLGVSEKTSVVPGRIERATLGGLGFLRNNTGLLLVWDRPGTQVEVERRKSDASDFPGKEGLFTSVILEGDSGSVRLYPVGKAEARDLPTSYGQLVRYDNRLESLRVKTGGEARHRALLGAAIFHPLLDADGESRGALANFESLQLFSERLHDTLEIDQALLILEGWGEIHQVEKGWDVRISQNAGGEEGLRKLTERIRELQYLLGLVVTPRGESGESFRERLQTFRGKLSPDLCFTSVPESPAGESAENAFSSWKERGLVFERAVADEFRLTGSAFFGEEQLRYLSYVEGLWEPRDLVPGSRFYPFVSMAYGNLTRLAVRPADAVGPGEPEKVLAHLLLGEVPLYQLPGAPAGKDPSSNQEQTAGEREKFPLARADGGWGEGLGLTREERFLKNTFETLSPVARIRYREPLRFYRNVTADGHVKEVFYGDDLRIVVNFGDKDYEDRDWDFVLPRYGFWVHHPHFVAFHALRAFGIPYQKPALFTVRSLEGKLYLRAEKVRIWHGFGPHTIRLGGRDFKVPREAKVRIW